MNTRQKCTTAWTRSLPLLTLLACGTSEPAAPDPSGGPDAPADPECVVEEAPVYAPPIDALPPMPVAGVWEGTFVSELGTTHAIHLEVDDEDYYAFPWAVGNEWVRRRVRGSVEGWLELDGAFLVCLGRGDRPCTSIPRELSGRPVLQGDVFIPAFAPEEFCAQRPTPVHLDGTLDSTGTTVQGHGHIARLCHELLPDGLPSVQGTFTLTYLGPGE